MMKSKSTPSKNRKSDLQRKACWKKLSYSFKVRCMVMVCLLLAATAATLLYFLLNRTIESGRREDFSMALPKRLDWTAQCPEPPVRLDERFNCFPDAEEIRKDECHARGCCYLDDSMVESVNGSSGAPVCVYPKNYGYAVSGKTQVVYNGFEVPLRRIPSPSRYGDDIQLVHMKVEMQTRYRLRIKFYDPENERYEVPVPSIPVHSHSEPQENKREVFLYSVTYNTATVPFAVKVRRSNTDTVLFDTSFGALTLSNQFLELTTRLPSLTIYGLGQHVHAHQQFHHSFNWKTHGFFSSAKPHRSQGVHPMYLCMENDGKAHGLLLLNSNAMEAQLHPSPAITFRTIGGILDFYLFLGPTPEDVIQQYTEAVGFPAMPPYWALGLHIGQNLYQSTSEVENFIENFSLKFTPMEAVTIHSEAVQQFMSKTETFLDLSNLTTKLHNRNQKLSFTLKPSITKKVVSSRDSVYSLGLQQDVFVTDKWGLYPVVSQKDGHAVIYLDYGSSSAITWWDGVLDKMLSKLQFDGLWLTNNEPTTDTDGSVNSCMTDNLNKPPYIPFRNKDMLYQKTLCMDSTQHWKDVIQTHYDVHNIYGHSMVMATDFAIGSSQSKRKLLLSDSTFIGTGQYAGHWIRHVGSGWEGLRASIPSVLEMGLFGIPFVGSNICNISREENLENTEELCLRWIQLAIFYPFLQLYDVENEHKFDSGRYSKEFTHAVRNAISRRYELLPYLYTLFYFSHTRGSTVMRPLFHEFPFDNRTYTISTQFMWGPALLISPVLHKGEKQVKFYAPEGVWYNFYSGSVLITSGEWVSEPISDSKQPAILHLRAGHIITLQNPANTTAISRQNPMTLLVALNDSFEAHGSLFWDDGETKNSHLIGEYVFVEFTVAKNLLLVNGMLGRKVFMSNFYTAFIQRVKIMGLQKPPKRITIDGSYILSNKQYHWDYDNKVLELKYILIPIARRTEVQWIY